MAGCVPCFIIPLLLFIFHRYIQPILLRIWNPWEKRETKEPYEFSCKCPMGSKKGEGGTCPVSSKSEDQSKSQLNEQQSLLTSEEKKDL